MAAVIIKLADHYLEWSTISDAPTTRAMTLDEFWRYYSDQYGVVGLQGLPSRMVRVEAKGTSDVDDDSVDDTIDCNRAGAGETELTRAQLEDFYVRLRGRGPRPLGTKRGNR
jgi:hypothetical protein